MPRLNCSTASIRSSVASHLVLEGGSGRRTIANVTTPSIINSLGTSVSDSYALIRGTRYNCDPLSPCAPSMEVKVTAAIRPVNELAKYFQNTISRFLWCGK